MIWAQILFRQHSDLEFFTHSKKGKLPIRRLLEFSISHNNNYEKVPKWFPSFLPSKDFIIFFQIYFPLFITDKIWISNKFLSHSIIFVTNPWALIKLISTPKARCYTFFVISDDFATRINGMKKESLEKHGRKRRFDGKFSISLIFINVLLD